MVSVAQILSWWILTPDLPTKISPTKIARLKLPGKIPAGLGIRPLESKIVLESNPLKSRILVRRLDVACGLATRGALSRPCRHARAHPG